MKIHANVWNHCEGRKVGLPQSLAMSQDATDLCARCALGLSEGLGRSFGNFTAASVPRHTNLLGSMAELEAMYFEKFLQ